MNKNGKTNLSSDDIIFEEVVKLRDDSRLSEALHLIEHLLPKYPRNIAILAVAAHLNWRLGDLEKAIDIFRAATRIDSLSEIVSLGLFHCLWEIGRKEEALEETKRFMSVSYSKDYAEIVQEILSASGRQLRSDQESKESELNS